MRDRFGHDGSSLVSGVGRTLLRTPRRAAHPYRANPARSRRSHARCPLVLVPPETPVQRPPIVLTLPPAGAPVPRPHVPPVPSTSPRRVLVVLVRSAAADDAGHPLEHLSSRTPATSGAVHMLAASAGRVAPPLPSRHGRRHGPRCHRGGRRARRRPGRERRRGGLRLQGRGPHHHRAGGGHRVLPPPEPAHAARRRGRAPHLRPLQAGQPAAPPGPLDGVGRQRRPAGADRPGDVHVHRRSVRGRVGRPDPRGRPHGALGRRHAAARRGVQAAHLAVRVPGPRPPRAGDPRRRARPRRGSRS